MASKSPLRRLSDIISDAVDKIEKQCAIVGLPLPSLDSPFNPAHPSEALVLDPGVVQNSMIIVAAADQIISTVKMPQIGVFELTLGFYISSSIQTAIKGNFAEIIREGDPKGVHAKDIAAINGMDAEKISRILRLLATHHIFREITPDVWVNNRLSSFLDTMKPTSSILASPENKHVGTPGIAAWLEHATDDGIKAAAMLPSVLTNPNTARSDELTDSAWAHAMKIKTPFLEWLQLPGNEQAGNRFNIAMDSMRNIQDVQGILKGFPWNSVPEHAKIVDVGGGIGSVSLAIAQQFPKFKLVIQDLPTVRLQAENFLDEHLPGARESGRVTFQAHDFFTPQTIKDADLFLLRMITHDWPKSSAIKILKHLRDAAQLGKTQLLIVDPVVPYSCADLTYADNILRTERPPVPEPLLQNLGKGQAMRYLADIHMLALVQGQARPLMGHIEVMLEAGWRVTHVYDPPGSAFGHIVAEPA